MKNLNMQKTQNLRRKCEVRESLKQITALYINKK